MCHVLLPYGSYAGGGEIDAGEIVGTYILLAGANYGAEGRELG